MDDNSNLGTFPNETERLVILNTSKRKHSDSVDDNENTKKQKIDPQNDKAEENIKYKTEKEKELMLQLENDVSPVNKEENIKPTHSELDEIKIAHLKENIASSIVEQNELKSNVTTSQIENAEKPNDFDNQIISKTDDSQIEHSELFCEKEKTEDSVTNTVCETTSASDTNSKNSDNSSSTGIDTLYSRTSAVPDPEPIKREEAKKFRKLYRLLRESENKDNGLSAKNPRSNIGVAEHVANGSSGGDSRYISTCSTLSAARNLLRLKTKSKFRNGTKKIVEIDVNNLPLTVKIIDLTEGNLRKTFEFLKEEEIIRKFNRYAESHGEVLLVGYIPAYCLQYV